MSMELDDYGASRRRPCFHVYSKQMQGGLISMNTSACSVSGRLLSSLPTSDVQGISFRQV
jgi:hypothetical protein